MRVLGFYRHTIGRVLLICTMAEAGTAHADTLPWLVGFAGGLAAEELFSVPTEFSLWSVVLALGMAVGVGLPSGIYPAYKAAKLEPIEALRAVGG